MSGATAEQVRFAATAWPMKVAQELRSAGIFAELERLEEHREYAAEFGAARRDELRHAELCGQVAQHFGEAADRFLDDGPLQRRFASLPDGRLRYLALLLVEVAVGETVSTSLFRAGARKTREPVARGALWQITRDEAGHARLGWKALAKVWPQLTAAERDFGRDELRLQLGLMEREQALPSLLALERGEAVAPELEALGVLSPETRVNALYFAIERQVLPRLERVGIDGPALWAQRHGSGR